MKENQFTFLITHEKPPTKKFSLQVLSRQVMGVTGDTGDKAKGGMLEFMLHRHLSQDDGRGLAEAVQDSSSTSTNHWFFFDNLENSEKLRRKLSVMLEHPVKYVNLLFFLFFLFYFLFFYICFYFFYYFFFIIFVISFYYYFLLLFFFILFFFNIYLYFFIFNLVFLYNYFNLLYFFLFCKEKFDILFDERYHKIKKSLLIKK